MTTTDHTTPTGQDYLAMSLVDLATPDSRERFEQLIEGNWNPEFARICRDQIMVDSNTYRNALNEEENKELDERISNARHLSTPEIPSTLPISEVRDLEFIRVSDPISHKWVVWEVRFTYDGKPCCGDLGACPNHPDLMHEETMENCETNF